MSSTLEASASLERISQKIYIPSKIQVKISLKKQMFDISEKLTVEQSDEIFGVSPISWEISPWKQLSLLNEEVISLSHAKCLCILRFCVMSWKGESEPNINNYLGRTVWLVQRFTTKQNFRHNDGEPMEFEWTIFPGFTTLQLVDEVQKLMNKMGDPAQFQGRINFMSMFNDIIW